MDDLRINGTVHHLHKRRRSSCRRVAAQTHARPFKVSPVKLYVHWQFMTLKWAILSRIAPRRWRADATAIFMLCAFFLSECKVR